MIKQNAIKILEYLANYNISPTIYELADFIGVSDRTIRNYIDEINIELPSLKVKIENGLINVDQLILFSNIQNLNFYLSTDFKKNIMLFFIAFNESINLTHFSNKFDISRSTAKNYIKDIKFELSKYRMHLNTDKNKGLKLVYNEDSIRILQLRILLNYHTYNDTEKIIFNDFLSKYFQEVKINKIAELISDINELKNLNIQDTNFLILRNILSINIKRALKNKIIPNNEIIKNNYHNNSIQKKLIDLYHQHNIFNIDEINYFMNNFLYPIALDKLKTEDSSNLEYKILVYKIISDFSLNYGIDLTDDKELFNSLVFHIKSTLFRISNMVYFTEIDGESIKKRFPREFNLIEKILKKLNFYTNYDKNKNEIALITIHFITSINNYHQNFPNQQNVIIVCANGYGASKLIEQEIGSMYNINIIDCIPLFKLYNYEKTKNIDYIISPIPNINYKNIKTVKINAVLTKDDFENLDKIFKRKSSKKISLKKLISIIKNNCNNLDCETFIDELKKSYNNILYDDYNINKILDFLTTDNIMLNVKAENWEDAIKLGGELLYKNGYCELQYMYDLVYSFQNYGEYMIIDDEIIIPHAKANNNVNKTGISLVVLNNPVYYNNNIKIKAIFSFCSFDNEEHLNSLIFITKLLKNKNFKNKLMKFKENYEVIDFLKSNQ